MMSSVNHDDFAHLKIPLADVLSATNNFDEENIVGKDGFEKRYWGQLLWSGELIDIHARRFDKDFKHGEQMFWMEISMLSSLKHKNLVSLVGFCDENDEKIIITKRETRASLSNYLSDPMMLTWVRRLEISVGIAHALSYIHYDESRDFSVIHRLIGNDRVLLNDDWEAKLSDFRCSMKIKASERHHSFHTNEVWYVEGYGDPTYIETKSAHHKSDIYSFGIVLFELLCGRESIITDNNNKYLAPLAITHYRERTLYDIIDPDLWRQMDPQSFNIFAEIAFDCLNEDRSQRPNIDEIVIRLEKALRLQLKRENVGSVSFISAGVESHVIKNIKRVDAKYKNTGGVTHKLNVYSFRVVLSKAMSGRRVVLPDQKLDRPFARQVVKRFDIASRLQSIYENPELPRNVGGSTSSNHDKGSLTSISAHVEFHVSNKTKSFLKDLSHLKLNYQDIKSATNNFAVENFVKQFKLGTIYKGRLLHSEQFIDIIVKRFVTDYMKDESRKIWMEISMLSSLKHKNLVSLIGFCDEEHVKMIIYKKEANRSLETYLGDHTLTWMQRLKICVGVANALSYIHYDFSVIHCNIRSSKILLDDKWEPKLSGFKHSLKSTVARRHRLLLTHDIVENVYMDPKYKMTGGVTHKSDVYSFGVVLFEVLCGRSAEKGLGEGLLCQLVNSHLDDMIDPHLRNQMDQEALKIFSETAYCCIKEERADRPYINHVVKRLEEALELQSLNEILELQRNATDSTSSSNHLRELPINAVDGTSSNYNHLTGSLTSISTHVDSHVSNKTKSFLKDLSQLKLGYQDIKSATNNFAVENIIEQFKLGTIYKGRLLHSELFIDIIVKRFITDYIKDESKKIWTEISMLSSLKHMNMVSLIGFCDEEHVKMIIYKKEANGSLETYLGDENLTWMQRLKICLGVANALSYIHYDAGRDFSVIHCNVRSSNILLDDEWEPKLSGFELALKNTVARRNRLLLTRDIVKNVYLDPKYNKTYGVTHKSDVYSFGVVLYEVVCGRSAILPDEELGEGLLSQLKISHLDEMINPHLRKQMEPESFKIFSEIANYCTQEERTKRPHIDQVVKRLEKALDHQWRHENPVDRTSFNRLKVHN